uniref:DEP domain-containing protein n=1 Tax=Setaria digitata TaxID=48799 RepID=A0A915PT49_9BILA
MLARTPATIEQLSGTTRDTQLLPTDMYPPLTPPALHTLHPTHPWQPSSGSQTDRHAADDTERGTRLAILVMWPSLSPLPAVIKITRTEVRDVRSPTEPRHPVGPQQWCRDIRSGDHYRVLLFPKDFMAGHVQLRGFRVSNGHGATAETPEERDSLFEGRFRATRVWNGMIRRFRSGMQLKRHRRQLRIFDDCFTGREAVDFMMKELPKFIYDGREVTRFNCSKLLSIYLNMGLFCAVRGKFDSSEPFKENELYRFSSVSLELLAATPVLVRRAASFNEKCSFKQNQSKDKDFGFTAPQRIHNGSWRNRNNDLIPTRMPIPSMQPNPQLSRRLSASHGNLPSMLSSRKLNDDPSGGSSTKAILKETISQEKIDGFAIKNDEVKLRTSKKVDALDEVIVQLSKVNNSDTIQTSSTQNLRCFGKVIQAQNLENSSPSASPGAVVNEAHSGAHLFLDTSEIYKNVLLNRLQSLLQVDSLKGIIDYDFNGADVRWNCEHVGTKGIVRVQPENDYLTNYVITMMRYLSRWPFDTKFTESTHVPYEGFELNVFKSVCEQFDKDCPMLPNFLALSVLRIIQLFRQRSLRKQQSAELHKETVFCASSSPFTRYVQRTVNPQNHDKINGEDESRNFHTTISPCKGFACEEHVMSPPNATRSSVSTLSADNDSFSCKMAYEAILTRLPGLQRSPELMQRIEELARVNTLVPRASSPCVESCTLIAGIDNENQKLLKEAISLVMLTLEPRVRRRLHYLLRFMQRVSRNYCLRMDKRRDNRSVVLEYLPNKIIHTSGTINTSECRQLVIFLMDNECDTFSIPEVYILEVKHQLSLPHEVIIKQSPIAQQKTINETSTERLKEHFCEPIKVEEYESQKKNVDSHLLSLLDGILTDENLSVADRKQRLKKFKKTYPEIYAQKFPSPELPKTRLIDRIKNFHF